MEHLDGLKKSDFSDFDKPHKRAYQKGKMRPTSKTKREASRNEFVEKGGMPDRVKSFREMNSKKDHPRARPWFVKPI